MNRMTPETKDSITQLFSEKHWSCNMISKKTGFSRQGIKKFLNRAGYDTSKAIGRHVTFQCPNCGKTTDRRSCEFRPRKSHYCSTKCYYEFITELSYKPWRPGQRIARAMLRPLVEKLLGPIPFVSHHKDGNEKENKMSNLMALPDTSNHLAYHRHHRIVSVLIDGANF